MNGRIFITEYISDIQNTGSESMHSRDRNFESEGVRMCHWTVVMIKINTLDMRDLIFTVECNKIPFIITVSFLNTLSKELTEDLFSIRETFDQ